MNLTQQIETLEASIQQRRSKIALEIIAAKQTARLEFAAKATDPQTLFMALAAGFATDQLARGKLPIFSFLGTLSAALKK